ncbi:MAG: cbb3-type cytochrome oxidase assembly protein CcoS [Verrucomicrobiia bacterium]
METFLPYFIMLGLAMLALGGSALLALYWAARSGQYRNLEKSAEVIFDGDEPVGAQTDFFPGTRQSGSDRSGRSEREHCS